MSYKTHIPTRGFRHRDYVVMDAHTAEATDVFVYLLEFPDTRMQIIASNVHDKDTTTFWHNLSQDELETTFGDFSHRVDELDAEAERRGEEDAEAAWLRRTRV